MFLFYIWIPYFLFSFIQAKELSITPQNITILKSTAEPIQFKLRYNQEHIIVTYPNHESTISITIKNSGEYEESFCYAASKKIVFDDFQNRAQQVLSYSVPANNKQRPPNKYQPIDPQEQLSVPKLVNMVHITSGFAVITSDHQIIIFSINPVNDTKTGFKVNEEKRVQFTTNSKEVPQLVYDPITMNLYIIYKTEVLQANLQDLNNIHVAQIQLSNIGSSSKLGNVRIAHQHLFFPLGMDGLQFYKIEANGSLIFQGNLYSQQLFGKKKIIFIVDVAFGGEQGENMFILDRFQGITLYKIQFIGINSISVNIDNEFGSITIFGGNIIKEFNNTMIMVLCELIAQTYVVEVGLNMVTKEWFQVKTHFLFGHYSDLEITDSFAILRGVDSHLIIYHSIWQGFLPKQYFFFQDDWMKEEKFKDQYEYLIIPSLKQIKFYQTNYGLGDYINGSKNQNHPFLIGITGHNFIELPWIQVDPQIVCLVDKPILMGRKDKFIVELNSTQCSEKHELLNQNDHLISQLILCSQNQVIEVEVETNNQILAFEWLELGIGILILVGLVILVVVQLSRRNKQTQQKLNEEIKKLEERGYDASDKK